MSQLDFIIQQRYLDFRHGTGVQLKLFASQLVTPPVHICWDTVFPLSDTYRPVINLDQSYLKYWPFVNIGRGFIGRLEHKLSAHCYKPKKIKLKLQRFTRNLQEQPLAYVTVACEKDAEIACDILDALNAKYVLNIMDLICHTELSINDYACLTRLLKGATKVFVLTTALQSALAGLALRPDFLLLPTARKPVNRRLPNSYAPADLFKIVMVGSLAYPNGLIQLANFCKGLHANGIMFELHYIGSEQMRSRLDNSFPVQYHGALDDLKRDSILSTMNIAYLPGPDGDPDKDDLARFSFPSRLLDYFWHGLPVMGPLYQRSATYEMLHDLHGKGAWFSTNSYNLVDIAIELKNDPHKYEYCSNNVYSFAKSQLSLSQIVESVLNSF
jgi:hypothetical protein